MISIAEQQTFSQINLDGCFGPISTATAGHIKFDRLGHCCWVVQPSIRGPTTRAGKP